MIVEIGSDKKQQKRYKGVLTWNKETTELYTTAVSEAQAKNFLVSKFAEQYGVIRSKMAGYINQHSDRFSIKEVA